MGRIRKSVDGTLATITLNRPDVLNVFDYEMLEQLQEVVEEIRLDHGIRAIILLVPVRRLSALGQI